MAQLLAIIIFTAAVLNTGMAMKECKEEELRDCLSSLQHSVINHFHDLDQISKEKYCQDINKGKQCMDEAMENCQDKHSHMSSLISSFYLYLNQICTEKGKIYMEIAPCLQNHAEKFEKCKNDDTAHDDPMEEICKEANYLKCVAVLSKQVCDKGETFGEVVEEVVGKFHDDVCSNNSSILAHNYWILIAMLLIMFSIREKL